MKGVFVAATGAKSIFPAANGKTRRQTTETTAATNNANKTTTKAGWNNTTAGVG